MTKQKIQINFEEYIQELVGILESDLNSEEKWEEVLAFIQDYEQEIAVLKHDDFVEANIPEESKENTKKAVLSKFSKGPFIIDDTEPTESEVKSERESYFQRQIDELYVQIQGLDGELESIERQNNMKSVSSTLVSINNERKIVIKEEQKKLYNKLQAYKNRVQ